MRIGLVTGEYPPMQGGVGAHCRELARELSDGGHTVFVYTDPRGEETDPRIVVTHAAGQWRLSALRDINRWAHDNLLDVVNLHFQTAAFQMSPFIHWLPNAIGVPIVTTFHDLRFPYLFPKAGPLRNWIVMWLARASDGVISTNHEDFERVRGHHHAALIPIGSSVKGTLSASFDRDNWRSRLSAGVGDFVVAHFGFINHSKGVDTLLDAAARLVQDGVPLRLWLAGGRTGSSDPTNAAYADRIEHQARTLGLAGRLTWTGFLSEDEAAAAFAACDVVALPFRDGASYRRSSLMAAISHGCAIVTTAPAVDIPVFRDGVNLALVRPDDVPALADLLAALWRDPSRREALKSGARELARVFWWDGIARANADFFVRVAAEARR